MIVPSSFVMRLQVSLDPASSGCADLASSGWPFSGLPLVSILRRLRRRIYGSPRSVRPFSCAGDGVSGYPKSRILWRRRRVNLRVAPNLRSSGSACGECLSYPRYCTFRLCRRWIFESPRMSHPSAVLAVKLRVAPSLRSSNSACDEGSGCPESCIFRLPAVILRVAPNLRSSGYADGRFSELPRIAHPSAVPTVNLRVTPNLQPPAVPSLRLRVAPNPASTTGSMMNPRLSSNFASSACAEDESSRPSESCTFLPNA